MRRIHMWGGKNTHTHRGNLGLTRTFKFFMVSVWDARGGCVQILVECTVFEKNIE